MITRLPNVPPLSANMRPPRPLVTLLGGRNGTWQRLAAQQLGKVARCIIRTDVPLIPKGTVHPSDAWIAVSTYLTQSDVVVLWCGLGDEVLYLEEWLWASYAVASCGSRLVSGIERGVDHPMAPTLGFVVSDRNVVCYHQLDDLLAMAAERCRMARRSHHG